MTRVFDGSAGQGLAALISLTALLFAMPRAADAQLRVVTYNPTGAINPNVQIVLEAIGEQERNGIAKPIDILLLQEQNSPSSDTQTFVTFLNSIYGAGTYSRGGVLGGPFTSEIRQTIVYNTQTVDLLGELAFGNTVGPTAQERQTLRYHLRPDGYDSAADFYIYNSHYKASQGVNEATQRNSEAIAIRANSDALGEGTNAIYAGDHNFYDFDADEPAWGTLTAAGPGQANDPINRVGTWHDNATFADVHTQSPCTSGCGATGGMDDRFDFQLVTGEFLDAEGLDVIPGSYHAFGNNGTTFNTNINAATNTYVFEGVTTYMKSQILNALRNGTDHLPVMVDYQLPAIMNVVTDMPPLTLNQGDTFNLDVTVSNAANVLVAISADELDYSLTTSGDLFGSFLNQTDLALGGGNLHMIGFDTSTPGMKSGVITVMSTSQAVQNGLVNIPISFEVLAIGGLAGDYNENGVVDAADYTVWRDNFGSETSLPNDDTPGVAQDDFERWQSNFGTEAGSGATGSASAVIAAVPEPAASILLLLGVCLTSLRRSKLRAWTPRP